MMKIFLAIMLLVFSGSYQAKEDKHTSAGKAFSIEINSKLGKPLVALKRPSKDVDGKLPTKVLVDFLTLINTKNFEEAKLLCVFSVFEQKTKGATGYIYDHTIGEVEKEYRENAKMKLKSANDSFSYFATELRKYPKHTIGFVVKQKSNFWSVTMAAKDAKRQPWPKYLYMKKINNRWRIVLSGELLERMKKQKK